MKTICFDLDGVICTNTWGKYENAMPIESAIKKINCLYEEKNKIIIFTARFMSRNNENIKKAYSAGYDFTNKQLNSWGVKYHLLKMGKPSFDVLIDDKHHDYSNNWINSL